MGDRPYTPFEILIQKFDEEAQEARQFRKSVSEKLTKIDSWISVREALDAAQEKRMKVLAWGAGTLISILSVLVALLKK